MSGEVPYQAIEYGNGDSDEAVALVTGFAGKVADLEQAACDLAATGRDAVLYTYDPRILLAGDAELLPNFIDTLNTDFLTRTADHPRKRFVGVSLGGAIAANMQKLHDNPEYSLYAATGGDAAELVLRNRLFGAVVLAVHHVNIRQAYAHHGYELADLQERWKELQALPPTPFTVVLGGMDYIVRERKIRSDVALLQAERSDVRVIRKPWLGHTGTIKWLNTHAASLLSPELP